MSIKTIKKDSQGLYIKCGKEIARPTNNRSSMYKDGDEVPTSLDDHGSTLYIGKSKNEWGIYDEAWLVEGKQCDHMTALTHNILGQLYSHGDVKDINIDKY